MAEGMQDTNEDNSIENEESKSTQEEELTQSIEEIEELNNKLLRLQADFINFKKRSEKEKESQYSYGIECFVLDLLPILDNFERALNTDQDEDDGFYKGVKMVDLLKKYSIEEIDALSKPFDPNYHHAVVTEESKEHEPNTVIEVLQKGYMLKEKVIRPSMVKVSI